MKMSAPSQATFWQETELPLMSSRAAFRAKTLALLESAPGWTERAADYGPKSSDLLASYDPVTSSWRTSQTCLVARLKGEAGGLAEFSETWPSAGMMRSGKTFRRQPWALPIAESVYGLWATPSKTQTASSSAERGHWGGTAWYRPNGSKKQTNLVDQVAMWPTPQASDTRDRGCLKSPAIARRAPMGKQLNLSMVASDQSGALNPTWVEWLMGFPLGWTDLQG
jgi:hypothetical protein